MLPGCEMPEVGIREGEKLHEVMITREDSMTTYEYEKHYIIYPHFEWWNKNIISGGVQVKPEFEYSSGNNTSWLGVEELQSKLAGLKKV